MISNQNSGLERDFINSVVRKLEDSHIVYFNNSNSWIEFKEPAWLIYQHYLMGKKVGDISVVFANEYNIDKQTAMTVCKDVVENIKLAEKSTEIEDETQYPTNVSPNIAGAQFFEGKNYKTRNYKINDKFISLSFCSKFIESYLHRLFAHLETAIEDISDNLIIQIYTIELTSQKSLFKVLTGTAKSKIFELFEISDFGSLKHLIYTQITNYIYSKTNTDWLAFIHAAAVTDGETVTLLSSASGSGKSTLTSLLQLQNHKLELITGKENISDFKGFYFMSDDFVPISRKDLFAYTFPASLTVKKGAFDLIDIFYERDQDPDHNYDGPVIMDIRYLPVNLPASDPYKPRAVKNIVFLKYNPGIEIVIEKLEMPASLQRFHEEAWVARTVEDASIFIDWFVGLNCYRIEYGNNLKAITAIQEIFSNKGN